VSAWVVSARKPPLSFFAALPDDALVEPRDWINDLPTAYYESLSPLNVTRPCLWRPRQDEGGKVLIQERRIASRDEYRHLVCYDTYHAAINTALETIMEAIRLKTYSSQAEADTWGLFDATARMHMECSNAREERLTYPRRFKCKKLLTGEEWVAELLVYSRSSTPRSPNATPMESTES
jgi:hypothetical protein